MSPSLGFILLVPLPFNRDDSLLVITKMIPGKELKPGNRGGTSLRTWKQGYGMHGDLVMWKYSICYFMFYGYFTC